MFAVMGSVTADLLVVSQDMPTGAGDDGFRSSNLFFTDAPLAVLMGGNGGNSAYVLAGLGAPTALIGAIGRDPLGDLLAGWLAARHVGLDGLLRMPDHATSTSTIIMRDAASQTVYHHLGSTAQIGYADVPDALWNDVDLLLAGSLPIMTKMRAGGFGQALARVHGQGGITALDIGPAIGAPVTPAELAPLLPDVDYLLANTHELTALTGADDWRIAAGQVLAAGARHVIIKRGAQGAVARTVHDEINVPAFAVTPNISVGAGDSFNVGLLYALQQGQGLEGALRFGSAVAALVVASARGVLGGPTAAEVTKFLESENW